MAQVTVHEDAEADWLVTGPLGLRLHWRTRVLEDRPGEFIAWSAQPGALLPHAVEIRSRPLARERGTEVELRLRLMPPGGLFGTMAASRLAEMRSGSHDDQSREAHAMRALCWHGVNDLPVETLASRAWRCSFTWT